MLYDNVYVLGELFHHFLLENPDIQAGTSADDSNADITQRLETWLESETQVTDLTHKTTLLQLASSYDALVELRDTLTVSSGL